ncbi:MAG: hypothetical protein KC657_31290 [Myxococcales bacterium]|nr:hypothetical protein [Myxococcales bacterium]
MAFLLRSRAARAALAVILVVGGALAACDGSNASTPTIIDPEGGLRLQTDGALDGDAVADGEVDAPPPEIDAGDDAPVDAGDDGTISVDAGPTDETVGNVCAADVDCEKVAPVDKICTKNGFAVGSINPTPVCIGVSCTIFDPNLVNLCDGAKGVCVLGGVCMPQCTFDATKMTSACAGKNMCNVHKIRGGGPAPFYGVGYCYRGCRADLDCPGESCQVETGECVVTKKVFTKALGDTCTAADDGVACKCRSLAEAGANQGKGYCTTFCAMGEACPMGYQCSAELPLNFGGEPKGLAGNCLKTCVGDADCTALASKCRTLAGNKRVCVPAN